MAEQRVDERRLAGRAGAEHDDVKLPALAARLDFAQFAVQAGLGGLIRHLPDHFSGVLGLNRRGLDHVVGGLSGGTSMVPRRPEQPAGPERADGEQHDQARPEMRDPSPANAGQTGRAARPPSSRARPKAPAPGAISSASGRSSRVVVACCQSSVVSCQLSVVSQSSVLSLKIVTRSLRFAFRARRKSPGSLVRVCFNVSDGQGTKTWSADGPCGSLLPTAHSQLTTDH